MSTKQASIDRLVLLTQSMLDGSTNYLEGCMELVQLREALGAYENDPMFFAFAAVQQEIASIPVDSDIPGWSELALMECKEEYEASEAWVREHTQEQCRALLMRFSDLSGNSTH